jgi:FAD/FMN-containing dehydrogenase
VKRPEGAPAAKLARIERRDFLKALSAVPFLDLTALDLADHAVVNDVHTALNPTEVQRIEQPTNVEAVQALLTTARKRHETLSICGSRHATGGQQFAANSVLLDMRQMRRVVHLDPDSGLLIAEAGVEWPELIRGYSSMQLNGVKWGIRQKQGGGDHMTLSGALSANAHGHCLGAPPLVGDVEWLEIVTADGKVRRCSRKTEPELFSLAIGGYGLFGIISTVALRLVPRSKVRRRVEAFTIAELVGSIEKRAAQGATFGYFQYNTDETSLDFLRTGVLTTYAPVPDKTPLGDANTDIEEEVLAHLLEIAHKNRRSAYARYAKFELSKDGNVEWSDLHQLSTYPAGYHQALEKNLGPESEGADLIWELHVPRAQLISFLEEARRLLLKSETPLVYGTVRFIEQDKDSFLPWAQKRYACVIFTPHCSRETAGLHKAGELCRQLEQAASKRGGSFYLTYNRFAGKSEMAAAYPQFADFLRLKKKYDPGELFQSEWYRYYREMYS